MKRQRALGVLANWIGIREALVIYGEIALNATSV
jgi:hypothetical protein